MAQVTLLDLWVTSPFDVTQASVWPLVSLKLKPEREGEVRRRASGRLQAVTRTGLARSADVELQLVDRDTVENIVNWQGLPVLFRDPVGNRFWATYFSPDITPYPDGSGLSAVTLTFQEVTIDET